MFLSALVFSVLVSLVPASPPSPATDYDADGAVWLSPPDDPDATPPMFNTNIVNGEPVLPKPSPIVEKKPAAPPEIEPGGGRMELTGYPVDLSPADVESRVIVSSGELPRKNNAAALPGQSRSLVAFYALKGDGEPSKVKFSSILSTPSGNEERAITMRVLADGNIRIVPLFFGLDISPSTPPGKYSITWRGEEISSGHYDSVAASFMKASTVGSADVDPNAKTWKNTEKKKVPQFDPDAKLEPQTSSVSFDPKAKLPAPATPAFDDQGVGLPQPKSTEYKFETSPEKPKNKRETEGFSPASKQNPAYSFPTPQRKPKKSTQ